MTRVTYGSGVTQISLVGQDTRSGVSDSFAPYRDGAVTFRPASVQVGQTGSAQALRRIWTRPGAAESRTGEPCSWGESHAVWPLTAAASCA